jgi:very-short-patch-repair endonuclease
MTLKELRKYIPSNLDKLKIHIQHVNSIVELCKQYGTYNNGKSSNFFKQIIIDNKISTQHWDSHRKTRLHPYVEKECPVCKNKFQTQSGDRDEKTYCSQKCCNSLRLGNRYSIESKEKTSKSIRTYNISVGKIPKIKLQHSRTLRHVDEYICKMCGIKYHPCRKESKYCSNKCSGKDRINNLEYRKKLSDAAKLQVLNGTHKGWKPRSNPSYPEIFFMKVLKNNNIDYKHDERCGKYYIDFAIENKKIALEIDGKQHKWSERKLKDAEKDKYLIDNSWKVYRIEWNTINNEVGKKLMKEKIDKFLEFYNLNED